MSITHKNKAALSNQFAGMRHDFHHEMHVYERYYVLDSWWTKAVSSTEMGFSQKKKKIMFSSFTKLYNVTTILYKNFQPDWVSTYC